MKTHDEILLKLKELEADYNEELKNGTDESASDNLKRLGGKIYAIKWVLGLL